MFDGMPPSKKGESAPLASGADLIGDLPDSIFHHMLSFLPAQAAVQTCVLARRWRHLWRSTTGLRIVALGDDELPQFDHLRKFMDHLLNLRERTDLETVEIKTGDTWESGDAQPYVNQWIRFAVMCNVRVLNVGVPSAGIFLDNLPLVSRHLRTLDLDGVTLEETFLDFANCPALEDLKMSFCYFDAGRISSRSLKHLSISDCESNLDCRVHVSTPGLISLKLVGFVGRTPFLEYMALLETAYVDLDSQSRDVCLSYDSGVFCGANNNACENCVAKNYGSSDCVLLGGISTARHLELRSHSETFIFIRDLKHCPTFGKLKTLLLNEYWCNTPDLDPLACILKNSPVLEKLTLELFSTGPNHQVKMKGSYSSMEGPFAISEHLKMVEVECNVVDEKILKVLKFLTAFNILSWWKLYGTEVPNLQKMAMRILGLTSSSSGCERNWSIYEMIHTKRRNRLTTDRLNNMVFVQFNQRMLSKKQRLNDKKKADTLLCNDASEAQGWLYEGGDDHAFVVFRDEEDGDQGVGVHPVTGLSYDVIGEAMGAHEQLQRRRSARNVRDLEEEEFDSADEEMVEEEDIEFEDEDE